MGQTSSPRLEANVVLPAYRGLRRTAKCLCAWTNALVWGTLLIGLGLPRVLAAQQPPRKFSEPIRDLQFQRTPDFDSENGERVHLDPAKTYTLCELIDIAQRNNPGTRVAWERAKEQAAQLRVERGALYPTIALSATVSSDRRRVLFASAFYRQTEEAWQPEAILDYTVFDFGKRRSQIDFAKAHLLSADFGFNDVHRNLIFEVTTKYYALLDAIGRKVAAEATLVSATTVQQAAEERLKNGLATLPDVLEARASTARAEYELASVLGAEQIARGELARALGASPASEFSVQGISELEMPVDIDESIQQMIRRALEQRPDLKQQVELVHAAQAETKRARSAFFPSLSFGAWAGTVRAEGQQELLPALYTGGETWSAHLHLNWTVFDGTAREAEFIQATAKAHAEEARLNSDQDRVAVEVWDAFAEAKTAIAKQKAAGVMLSAASQSYDAALEAYKDGVRDFLDVVSAERALAQARTDEVSARTEVLEKFATLAFRTSDISSAPGKARNP